MSKRLISTFPNGTKLYLDTDWGEYIVKMVDGETYHANDLEDAMDTAEWEDQDYLERQIAEIDPASADFNILCALWDSLYGGKQNLIESIQKVKERN